MALHIFDPKAASASGGRSNAFKSALVLSLFFWVYSLVSLFAEPILALYLEKKYGASGANATHIGCNGTDVRTDGPKKTLNPGYPGVKFMNPLYMEGPEWRAHRWLPLLGLTRREAMFCRRMLASIVLGALIGLERREANRGAGIRTMGLVCLGSCVFTIGSVFAFEDGTQMWDASRVSAALPAGVGFLGGALIFKDSGTGHITGLTTACGVWLSCAVGVCCGGGLYISATFATSGMVFLLRFGPRSYSPEAHLDNEGEEEEEKDTLPELGAPLLQEQGGIKRQRTPDTNSPEVARTRSSSDSVGGLVRRPSENDLVRKRVSMPILAVDE